RHDLEDMPFGRTEVGPFPIRATVYRPNKRHALLFHLTAGARNIVHQETHDRRTKEIALRKILVKHFDKVAADGCQFYIAHVLPLCGRKLSRTAQEYRDRRKWSDPSRQGRCRST